MYLIVNLIVETGIDPKGKGFKQQVADIKKATSLLKKIGYRVNEPEYDRNKPLFLHICRKNKTAIGDSGVTGPACMANIGRRPIPIKGFIKNFKVIMNAKTTDNCLTFLEKLSFDY